MRHFLKILPAFVFSYSLLFPEQSHLPPGFQLSPLNWWLPNLLSRCLPRAPPFIFIHSFSEHLLGSYYMPGAEDSKTDNSCPRRSPTSSPSPLTCSQGLHIQPTQISSSCCVCCHTDQSVILSPDLICPPPASAPRCFSSLAFLSLSPLPVS